MQKFIVSLNPSTPFDSLPGFSEAGNLGHWVCGHADRCRIINELPDGRHVEVSMSAPDAERLREEFDEELDVYEPFVGEVMAR